MNNNKLRHKLYFSIFSILLVIPAWAETIHDCESIQSGIWEDAANWTNCNGLYPGLNTDGDDRSATIKSGHVITLGLASVQVVGFTMEANSELVVDDQFNTVILEVNPEPFDSELGQITINAENFVIDSRFNDIRLGAVDGDADLELIAETTIYFNGDIGATVPLRSLNTRDLLAFIEIDSTRSINLNGAADSTIYEFIILRPNAVVTVNHSGTGRLTFNRYIEKRDGSPQRLFINKDHSQVRFNGNIDVGQLNISGSGTTVVNSGQIRTTSASTSSGEMMFNTVVEVLSDTTFVVDGNVGELYFNAGLDQSTELGSHNAVTVDVDTVAHVSQVGQTERLGALTVTGGGTLQLNGNVATENTQSYQVPVSINQNTTFSTDDLVQFTQQLNGGNSRVTLNMGGSDFEISALDFVDVSRVNIGGSGTSQLSADWVTSATLELFQNLTTIGDVRLAANTIVSFNTMVLNGGDLTIGGTGASLLSTFNRVGTTEKLIVDFDNDNQPLSMSQLAIFNVPIDVHKGLFSSIRSQHNEDITIRNTAQIRAFAMDVDAGLVIRDEAALLLVPGNFDRSEVNSVSYPSGIQRTVVTINGAEPARGYGQIAIQDGPVILGGSLETQVFAPVTMGDEFIIIDNLSANPVVNAFDGLPEGGLTNDGFFTISYAGGDGNDVVLTAACNQETEVTYRVFPGNGATTLEQDIEDACDGGVLNFGPDIGVNTIGVGETIVVDKSLTFNGRGYSLRGPGTESLFAVTAGNTLTLNQINIINTSGDGAILNQGILNTNNVYFAHNTHTNLSPGGGGAILNLGEAQINNSTFYRNDAERGGAIFNDSAGVMTITNSTFYENGQVDAIQGGAIHNYGSIELLNSTLVDSGGGNVAGNTLFNTGVNASLLLQNTVIEATSALVECQNLNGASLTELNSFVDDGSCGASLFGVAGLAAWADEGAYANTISPLPGSQLIDAGDDVVCPARDVLGTLRPQRFQCDIGAVEFAENSAPSLLAVNLNGTPLSVCQNRADETATGFDLTFSEPMLNAADELNYMLVYAGADLNFEAPFDADNQIHAFVAASSDNHPQTPTVNLSLDQTLMAGLYRLELSSVITDEFANPLNAGDDLFYQFRIDPDNLLTNGDYDDCDGVDINQNWQYSTSAVTPNAVQERGAPGEFIPDVQDLFGSEHSGGLRIFTFDADRYYQLAQCQNLTTDLPLNLSASIQLQSFFPTQQIQGGDPTPDLSEVRLQCQYWDAQDCMGTALGTEFETATEVGAYDISVTVGQVFNRPPTGTASVLCEVRVRPDRPDTFTVLMDGLKLVEQDAIFAHGFEQ